MKTAVKQFKGQYSFLSNFAGSFVWYEGVEYPTVEHAFQAAKTLDLEERKKFEYMDYAGNAKKCGRKVTLRPDWEEVKVDIMLDLLRQKFKHEKHRQPLIATGTAHLEEGNNHGDKFWGTVRGEGKNTLGKLLMQVREEILNEGSHNGS